MRYNILILFLISFVLYSQSKTYFEYNDSGERKEKFDFQGNTTNSIKNSLNLPYASTPDWQITLYRQAGGIAWGDYDGDGDLDLAVGNYFSQSYPVPDSFETQIYRNDNGVLTTYPVWKSSDMRSTTDIKFADVNGDGRIDLLACNGDASFASSVIYYNSANGLSQTPGWVSTQFAWSVGSAFADVDGDGDLDLAFGNQGVSPNPYKPIALFHNTNGQFPTSPSWISADQMITNSVAWNDINNSDIISTSYVRTLSTETYALHLPNFPVYKIDSVIINSEKITGYNFDIVNGFVTLGVKAQIGSIVKIFYKYMKKPDLAAAKWVNFSSGIYFNDNGVLTQTPVWTTGGTESQKGCAWGDYNNDGYLDLAIGGSSIPTVIYKNNAGVMSTSPVWSSASSSTSSQEVVWADVNNDGWLDLAIAHFSPKKVEIYFNNSGVLETSPSWSYVPANGCNCLAFGDVNGDGLLDLAIGTAAQPAILFINKLTKKVCKDIDLSQGWNLIAAPVLNSNMSVQFLFPNASSPAYTYSNGYIVSDTLNLGKGYWIKFNEAQMATLCGTVSQTKNIAVSQGWNLIGVFEKNVAVSEITTNPPNILASQFYSYQNGYLVSDTLKSGKGYWIKANQNGTIILPNIK